VFHLPESSAISELANWLVDAVPFIEAAFIWACSGPKPSRADAVLKVCVCVC